MPELIKLADGTNVRIPEGSSRAAAIKQLQQVGYKIEDVGDEFSFFEKFGYAWGEGKSDVQKASAWLTSRMPLRMLDNHKWNSALEESWFYEQATPDERLAFIRQTQEQEVARSNPALTRAIQEGNASLGMAGILGGFAKELASPTSLLPIGAGYKTMAVGGAMLGAEWEFLDQVYRQEKINAKDIGTSAVIGAAFAPVTAAVAKQFPKIGRAYRARDTRANRIQSTNRLQNYQDLTIRRMAQSNVKDDITLNPDTMKDYYSNIHKQVLKDMDIDEDQFLVYKRLSDNDLYVPQSVTQAKALVEAAEDRLGALVPQYRKPNLIGKLFGNISREAERVDPSLGVRFRQFDRRVAERVYQKESQLKPWVDLYKQAQKRYGRAQVRHAYGQQGSDRLYAMFAEVGGKDAAENARNAFRKVMDEEYDDLTGIVGHQFEKLENYHPTRVADYRGLGEKLGFKDPKTDIYKALEKYKTQYRIKGNMTEEQMATFNNRYVRGQVFDPAGKKNSATQQRRISRADITEEIADKFYVDPLQSISEYIGRTANDIEKVKFFGKKNVKFNEDGTISRSLNLNDSIGQMFVDLENTTWKHLDPYELADRKSAVRDLVNSRFGAADTQPSKLMRTIRSLGYMSTLPNPMTALVQLGDLGNSVYLYGVQDTFNSMFRRGDKHLTMKEMGLDNTITAEMNTVDGVGKALDWFLTASGFRQLDRFGKETLLNSAFNAGKRFANNADTELGKKWERKWVGRFGEQGMEKLKSDLRSGKMSDEVKDYLWGSLADLQPIGQSELPRAYHDNPNMRILYSLKSFMLKQLNFMGQEIADEARRNPRQAAKNLSRYMLTTGMAGMTVSEARRFLGGEVVEPEDLPDAYAANFLKMLGMNNYLLERYGSKGKWGAMAGEMIAPPHAWFVDAYNDIGKIAMGEVSVPLEDTKFYRHLPIGGQIIYNFFGGGLENKMNYNDSSSWLR